MIPRSLARAASDHSSCAPGYVSLCERVVHKLKDKFNLLCLHGSGILSTPIDPGYFRTFPVNYYCFLICQHDWSLNETVNVAPKYSSTVNLEPQDQF